MSIDAPAAQMAAGTPSADNFNYIDTYVEFIAEVILKFDNAIPESKKREQKELQQHKQFQIIAEEKTNLSVDNKGRSALVPPLPASDRYAYQFIKEINPPPPKPDFPFSG